MELARDSQSINESWLSADSESHTMALSICPRRASRKSPRTGDDPENHRLFIYLFTPEHPQYYKFEQLWIGGRIPWGSGAFFVKCRKHVLVTPGTPGFRCLEIFWRAGDPLPYIRDVTFAV